MTGESFCRGDWGLLGDVATDFGARRLTGSVLLAEISGRCCLGSAGEGVGESGVDSRLKDLWILYLLGSDLVRGTVLWVVCGGVGRAGMKSSAERRVLPLGN